MDILRMALDFLHREHPELRRSMPGRAAFTLSPPDKSRHGYSRAIFTSGKWTITIGHAVTPETIYNVAADYDNGKIMWRGQAAAGQVKETSYENHT